jgi:phage FluMu protein Com
VDKFNRRLVKVTKTHAEECKKLLKLMGVPYVDVKCPKFSTTNVLTTLNLH